MDENMNVEELANGFVNAFSDMAKACLLYTSDAADEL